MNSFTFTVRLLEIPSIKFYQNTIPFIKCKTEISKGRNRQEPIVVEAFIWGKIAYDLNKYYHVNDYLIMEGSFSIIQNFKNIKSIKLNVSRFYPFFIKLLEKKHQ